MCALMTFRNWVLFALVCAGLAAFVGWRSLPALPLDTGFDPVTLAAYQAEVLKHWIKFGLLGLGIPLLVLIIGRVACGKQPERI